MEHLTESERLPAVVVAESLLELLGDLEEAYIPEISGNAKAGYLHALTEAVYLLRTHAVPASHPWSIQ
jgi:hypothetical protein